MHKKPANTHTVTVILRPFPGLPELAGGPSEEIVTDRWGRIFL